MAEKRKTYTNKMIIGALEQTRGLIAPAAAAIGCDEVTIRRRLRSSQAVNKAWQEARAGLVDLAESKLVQAVQRGEPWAVALVIKTLGRDRGYGDALALSGPGITITVEEANAARERIERRLTEIRERMFGTDAPASADGPGEDALPRLEERLEAVRARLQGQ